MPPLACTWVGGYEQRLFLWKQHMPPSRTERYPPMRDWAGAAWYRMQCLLVIHFITRRQRSKWRGHVTCNALSKRHTRSRPRAASSTKLDLFQCLGFGLEAWLIRAYRER